MNNNFKFSVVTLILLSLPLFLSAFARLHLNTFYFAVIAVAIWTFIKFPKRTVQLIGLLIVILAIGPNFL